MASFLTEADLISKLEYSTSTAIFSSFSTYLTPLTDLKKSKKQSQALTRSLAKQFLPFLNRCLSILPKRLSNSSNLGPDATPNYVPDLLSTYRLCLDGLDLVASQLSCKPYTVCLQRLRLVYCLEAWGLYKEAVAEGFRVLERLRVLDSGDNKKKKPRKEEEKVGEFLPHMVESGDVEFARVVVEVVVAIVKCVALGQSKDGGDYNRVIDLVEEVTPWFSVLDANAYEKLHRVLVTYLGRCTLFLVGDLMNFDGNIVQALCVASLNEYVKSSLKDQIYKFSRRICSSLLLVQDDRSSVAINMLICILDSLASKCKVEGQNWEIEFFELVSYCANKCCSASTNFCSAVAEHLNDLAGDFFQAMTPVDMILRLYATGLTFAASLIKSRLGDVTSSNTKDEPAFTILLADGGIVCNLGPLLVSLRSYFYVKCKKNCVSCGVDLKGSAGVLHSESDSHYGPSLACMQKDKRVYLLGYLNALKFLCQPLAELVNSEKKQIVSQNGCASFSSLLYCTQEAFDQFLDVFLFFQSTESESKGDEFDGNKVILGVAVAAFTLSISMRLKFQKRVYLVKHIISSKWIQPQGLKYIFASLYNLGVHLYKNNQVTEASKALKLSCTASWSCVVLLCQMFMTKSTGSIGDLSEDVISEFVREACTRTAFLLDVLYQRGSPKLKKIIVNSLENWAVAEDLFRRLPGPMPLLKQWVKMECKLNKNLDADGVPSLYHLLLSSTKLSKGTIGKILQQELLAYEEMYTIHPTLCQKMQIETIDILLQDVYVTHDTYIERSRILLRKARALRACGFESLQDCIQCLSEAISIISGEKHTGGFPTRHQLAVAYCLRALCLQEAEPNSKQVLQDMIAASNIWLSIPFPDDGSLLSNNMVSLLYNIVDLLSIKGSMEFHSDIYKLMIKLFKQKNVPFEKFFSVLWDSRRLSHALCISPVYDELLRNLSRDCGEQFKSVDFWMQCLKGSPHSLVGFQQSFSTLFTTIPCVSCYHETSFQSDITVDDVKQAACELSSAVHGASYFIFLAGCLYYDLSEKLIASGHLCEALSYAKEAHRLRSKLFQENFTYSVERQTDKDIEAGDQAQQFTYGLRNLRVNKSIACELWYSDTILPDVEICYLSPWKVLQCYLESTLQVGILHEMIGNGGEAETFLLWGKGISCQQSLSLFLVAFSSVLGKLYRKKRSWDLSQNELRSAKQTLEHSCSTFSCSKCRLILEVIVDQQLADLSRNCVFDATRNVSMERLSLAESLYKSSLEKLNLFEWRNPISCPEEVEDGNRNKFACSATAQPNALTYVSTRSGPNAGRKVRKCRQTNSTAKLLLKEQSFINEHNMRLTRSRYRSQSQNGNCFADVQCGLSKCLNGKNEPDLSDPVCLKESPSEMSTRTVDGSEVGCICNKMNCWFCLVVDVKNSGLLVNYIYMKWELARRRLSLKVLSGRGKCLEIHGQMHEAHEIILQSIYVLASRNPFTQTYAPVSVPVLLDLVGREFSGDPFAIERAALLYDICWFSLKSYGTKENRTICCDLSHVQFQKIVSWLMLAFVLCREVPVLLQKVSRLLCVIYILSSSSEHFSLPSYGKVLSEGHLASFFHQASLGTHLTYQFFSSITGKYKAENLADDQGLQATCSTCRGAETCNLSRLAPKSLQDLEQFVTEFFVKLPFTTVICISLIAGPYATLLQELLMYPSCVHAWILLSRLNFNSQPIVMLLPVSSISEAKSCPVELLDCNGLGKHWHCPWGFTVIDEVAPAFKLILEENYLSSSICPLEDTKENRTLWWMRRKKLDSQLGNLLRKLEDLWFGPWSYVLLGEISNCKLLDSVLKKLTHNLNFKCNVDVNESILKVILGGGRYALDGEACISALLSLRKGCFIGKALYSDDETCKTLSDKSGGNKLSDLALQLLYEAVNELEEDSVNREPVILVLDCEVQMLPWENLPVLRNQEVYRMPSVGSICLTLNRSCNHLEQLGSTVSAFPVIDPLDAFYLLNPSGDLSSTQVEFENWFRDQNFEGKAGSAPSAEELTLALKSHDLFLYFGHGSGAQYISQQEIQKLERCAATLLMGCSSGSLSLNGSYIPHGTPLSYLLAGSPIIVANLWEVTDKDIDRFGKAMLDAWLKERSSTSAGCAQCNSVAKEFESMNLKDRKVTTKKKVQRKKEPEICDSDSLKNSCNHRQRIGSFMSQARDSCKLPFLIGASPVCYGVPTGIRRKDS